MSDKTSVVVDIPTVINPFFVHYIQTRVSGPGYIIVVQWNRECFFFRHIELNSRFIKMTMTEVTLDRPKISTGFSVISWICRLRPFHFAEKFSTEIFAPYGLLRPWSVFSEFVVSSWQFCGNICDGENEFISFLWYQDFFRIDYTRIHVWCIYVGKFLNVCDQNISFPSSPAINAYTRTFLVKLSCQIDEVLLGLPKGIIGPMDVSPNRLS